MAFDETKIYVRSGDGGDGMMSFRREKYVPHGGPSGGDGGNGGDVVLRVDTKLHTLVAFQRRVHFKAKAGGRGGSANKTGASASPLVVNVPPGTVVRDAETGAVLGDLVRPDDEVVVVKGGRGGRGNSRFVSASNQAPRIAERGEPGVERWLKLELKLIADVGLVGVPNAGKSTLLSVVSNAKPKIAAYPFTTLEPNLGVVIHDNHDLVFADIPGLIEGAHMGVGLGHSFLRHVQRTRLLIHMLDGATDTVLADYSQINTELALFDENLGEKPQIVVFNKIDLPDAQARWPEVQRALLQRGVEVIPISAATHQNTGDLVKRVFQVMSTLPDEIFTEPVTERPVYDLSDDEMAFDVTRKGTNGFRVSGRRIERAAAMTYWDYEEAVARFQQILETLGVSRALEEAGVQPGDTVYIGNHELEWSDE
jgi:GTP-binding protein